MSARHGDGRAGMSRNARRAPSPALSACHIPLAPDLQADILKEQSDAGSASATTTKSRQAASSELLKQRGIGRVPLSDTCFKGRIVTCPPPLSARWAVRQGTTARVFLSDTAHPCASLYSPPVPCCGCCLPWSPSSQPLMPRASCLCSKPSIPAQEQSQGAEPAKGTQLQRWLPSPPSLTQALLCTRKSHSYLLGRAPMTNPTCSRSSRVLALEPSGERPPPKGLL